ncbi:PREDICTED: protein ABIL2-like isoform X1 [Prunus mume]|uniref:Protein ABIL2-like isoform X1 n=2 Tax=Prunus mume TaxID=102107 RepID=A0ABM0PG58_PRUMU|nr:PREDICTED: protein ABIL2-like isoform X1 [Prunus mume]
MNEDKLIFPGHPGGKMQGVISSSSVSVAKKVSHHDDELFMQQRVLFSENLNELKNMRKQLYSAAEYFEMSYRKEDQKQLVMEALKDYVLKTVVNAVDHLGSMAYKVNGFLDENVNQVSETGLRLSCVEQRLRTCQDFVTQGGVFQNSLATKFPKHHRRYILPDKYVPIMDTVGQSALRQSAEEDLYEISTATTMKEIAPTIVSEEPSASHSAQPSPGAFQFTRISSKLEKRTVSPHRFPLPRCGSLVKRSSTMNSSSTVKQRYVSEPRTRRTISLPLHAERDTNKDSDQHSGKHKRLFKALLSMRKFRKDATLYKYLDEN